MYKHTHICMYKKISFAPRCNARQTHAVPHRRTCGATRRAHWHSRYRQRTVRFWLRKIRTNWNALECTPRQSRRAIRLIYQNCIYTMRKFTHTHTVTTIFGVSVRVLVRVTLNLRQLTHHLADWRIDPLNK